MPWIGPNRVLLRLSNRSLDKDAPSIQVLKLRVTVLGTRDTVGAIVQALVERVQHGVSV